MITRGHIFGIIATAVTLACMPSATVEAGFVTDASLEAFIPATSASSARPEGKSDYEPPAWLKQMLIVTARDADGSNAGTTTGTSSTSVSVSPLAFLGTPFLALYGGPGQQLEVLECPVHIPPDLGTVSPPPRG